MSMSIAEYKATKPAKYRAVRTKVDGQTFDSKREANVYRELRLLEHVGLITELKRQVPFTFTVNGLKVGKYIADFVYTEQGKQVVKDAKGYRDKKSPVYRLFKLKANLMKALHGIEVVEV